MSWGYKIILSFVVFIGVIFTMVYISMNQDISLVADNYYEQELAYEDQINRIKNTRALAEKLKLEIDKKDRSAKLTYPQSIRELFKEGTIQFFRPSQSSLDKEFLMLPGKENLQVIDLKGFTSGLWKVKINWRSDDKEFYEEINVVL